MEDHDFSSIFSFFCANSPHFFVVMEKNRVLYANAKTKHYFKKLKSIRRLLPHQLATSTSKKIVKRIKLPHHQCLTIRWHRFTLLSKKKKPLTLLMGEDISEIEALRKQAKLLNDIITKVPGFVFWKGKNLKLMGCNENFAKQAGLTHPSEVIGLTDYDLPWSMEQTRKFIQDDQEVLRTGTPKIHIEEKQRQLNGKDLFLLTSKVPLYEGRRISGILGIYIDVTAFKEAERALQAERDKAEVANRLKRDFILDMQHDIRTPISGMYGMAELLAKMKTPFPMHDIQSHLSDIAQAAKELLDYCNDILDFAYLEHGFRPLLNKPFSFKQLVSSIQKMQAPAAQSKKISLTVEYGKNVPDIVLGDVYRIKRVLINLISNAIKFTQEGFVKVRIQIEKSNLNKQEKVMRITIADSGIGIPAEKMDFIYETFSKVTPSNKGLYKGSGLGLQVVKQFIEEMNGNIAANSQLNQGTVFQVFLPLKLPLSNQILEG